MADNNNIQLDLSINENSINAAWLPVTKGATKSAKDSAAAFEAEYKKVGLATAKQFNDAFKAQAAKQDIIPKDTKFKAVQSLADVAGAVFLVKQAFDILKNAANATIDVILEGDRIVKAERRFEALASSVGIVAGVMQNDLKKAVDGFVDDTELLELSSEAFIRLGNNAKALPQVLEAARKTYAVFGGSVVDNSRKIISAAETGSSRTLKDIGLYINLDEAVKKYARSLGTVPALLTNQQKEQARLAAILQEAETRLGAVEVKAGATTSYTQLKVALNDLNDEFSKIANSNLGTIFQTLADYAKIVVTNIGEGLKRIRPAETLNEVAEKLDRLKLKARDYEAQLAELGNGSATLAFAANLRGQLTLINAQIADYKELIRVKGVNAKAEVAQTEDPAVNDERARRRAEVVAKGIELNNQLNASNVALFQAEYARTQEAAALERLNNAQKLQALNEYEGQKLALQKFYADNATASKAERDAANEILEQTHKNKMLSINMAYEEERKKISAEAQAQASADIESTADAISALMRGMTNAMLTQAKSMKLILNDLGKAFVGTFKTQLTGAIMAFAQGTKSGEEALHDMFNGILNAMAEMLISQGLGFILQGTAMAWAGVPNGAPLVAAGTAMVAFGAGLAAVTAANGGAVGATGGAGGGSSGFTEASTGTASDPNTPIADTTPTTPSAIVNINVERFVDRQAEGLWIADLLTERFEQDGVLVRST